MNNFHRQAACRAAAGLFILFLPLGAEAASSVSDISPEAPIRLEADQMSYQTQSGDVQARGKVDIFHLQDRYQTEYLYGNVHDKQYIIPGEVRWTAPEMNMTAGSASYNGMSNISHLNEMKGFYGTYYMQAEKAVFNRTENKAVASRAYITTEHAVAKVPDYRMEARTIDIYPNDRYVAHEASLYIKNFRLLTLKQFSGSLRQDESHVNMWSFIPRPDYDSKNGFGLKSSIQLPIGGSNDLSFFAHLAWYTQKGLKPAVGFSWTPSWGSWKLQYVKEESTVNDNHVWIEKKPDISFRSRPISLGLGSMYLGTEAGAGKWYEGSVHGNHAMWGAFLTGPSAALTKNISFHWRTGYRKDYYQYHSLSRSNFYYSMGIDGKFGSRWSAWTSFTSNHLHGETPYAFDTYDMEKPLNVGFKVQLTRLDAVGVQYSYDTADGNLKHVDYTYYRDMHSFTGWIMYREKDRETRIYIQPKDFRF
jgi:LPS-assembly protein